MSDRSSPPNTTQLQQLVTASQYVPSNRAIAARNAFWGQTGISLSPDVDCAAAAALAPSDTVRRLIEKQWTTPGFRDWFLNPQWEKEESQRLMHLAMSRLSEILVDEEDPGLVLSAAKEAREVYTKLFASGAPKFADAEVGEMSKEQLEEYLRRNANLVNQITTGTK